MDPSLETQIEDFGDSTDLETPDGRRQYNRVMRVVRRMHMYLGLFMCPWILLYGTTGFLFNHPGAFSDHEIRNVDFEVLANTALDSLSQPIRIARRVLERLPEEKGFPGGTLELVNPEQVRVRDNAHIFVNEKEYKYELILRLAQEEGQLHLRSPNVVAKTPLGKVWWQMKAVRLSGAIVIAISVLWAAGIGYVMYEVFRF